ncbi:guanylate kinase [Rapidithrix thailandica]|uniref:Guanylate kinase n=1 Tax=Rapidithrix thailandica TaxID=413964 RepID=A0AAW9SE17_9BACT
MNRKIVIFSAPSGAGKTTIVKKLLESYPELTFSISATTRTKRTGEVDEKDYYFLDEATFRQNIQEGGFVEYEEVYDGVFYGTLKSEIERIWQNHQVVVMDVDVKGGLSIKKAYQEQALGIFVKPPDVATLERRLRSRNTDSEESIRKRIAKAEYELTFEKDFEKVILNDSLEHAVEQAKEILNEFLVIKA